MRHLSNDDLLAFAEGGSHGRPHVESCAGCRAQVDALRGVLASIRQDEVPEPSPLFWARLSERVRRAVAAGPRPAPNWWARFGLWRPIAAVGACVTVVLAVFVMRGQAPPALEDTASRTATPVAARAAGVPEPAASGPLTGPAAAANAGSEAGAEASADASWELITDLATGIDLDSAGEAGLVISPGSTERAVGQLSDEERRSFAKLLLEELLRPEL